MHKNGRTELFSGLSHLAALLFAAAGLPVLIVAASLNGDAWHIVAFTIFGTSLVLLFLASTLFHLLPSTSRAKELFFRIDHAMIYLLIAGSYTAISLTVLRGPWGWSLFGTIWGLALLGIAWKAVSIGVNLLISTLLYLFMGWLGVVAIGPIVKALPPVALTWLIAGGIFYTIGAIFSLLESRVKDSKFPTMHDIFHIFVILGSASHFWLMIRYIAYL